MRAGRMGKIYRSSLHQQPLCLAYKGTSIIRRLLINV
jgi:hypothetical protein